MKQEDYIKNRLQDQINWYDHNSSVNRKIFKLLRIIQIIAAALIPFLSGLILGTDSFKTTGTVIVGVLGVIVTISTGILGLGRHQENWIEYRKLCEALEREKFLFETESDPYDTKNRFDYLVRNVETLIANENSNWSRIMLKTDKPEDTKTV